MRGLVSSVQRYSTKDGPGLRSTLFMVGCPLRCAWCANPECMVAREQVLYFRARCQRCGACARVDPTIEVCEDGAHAERSRMKEACLGVCRFDAYERSCHWMGVDEALDALLRDRDFYDESGGGVTVSGGEPLAQAGFVLELVRRLRAEGVSCAIDTCGSVPWETMREAADVCDLMLFDVKTADSELHRRWTGTGNELILENLRRLDELGQRLWVRLVVVGGCNDQTDDLRRRLELVASLRHAERVDVLPYHELGLGKYRALGRDYPLGPGARVSVEKIAEIRRMADELGLAVDVAEE